jgi:antirestriction protein ArdC
MALDVYRTVTDRIVVALENAQRWEKPWTSGFARSGDVILRRPMNAVTRTPYRGINVPSLWSTGRSSPHWATYRAWQSVGAQVRKGEKGTLVVFWKQLTRRSDETSDNDEDQRNTYWLARGYVVFNSEQVDFWTAPEAPKPLPMPNDPFAPIPSVEDFVARTAAAIKHGGDTACYIPTIDLIRMPDRAQFVGSRTNTPAEAYYGTLFHELGHWTGHPTRCARDCSGRFGNEAYAFEELVAELTSAFLSADHLLHHEPRQDHASYLASWLKVLRNDKRAVFTAASKAEQAVRFLTEHQWQPAAPMALAA